MAIERVDVFIVAIRYLEPFTISAGTSTHRSNVEVRLVDDEGRVGWGESSPSERVTGETTRTVVSALGKLAPALISSRATGVEEAVRIMDRTVQGNPAAKAAVDMAFHDLAGRRAGKPVWQLLGGAKDRVTTDLTLSLKPPSEMARDAVAAVGRGFTALKVKVGHGPGEDVERVRAIRAAVGSEVAVRIDANRGWNLRQAVRGLKLMEGLGVELAEEPLKDGKARELRRLRKETSIPIMADESACSLEDVELLIAEEAVDMFNIKLMKCGGMHKGAEIEKAAMGAGMPCMVGCMAESEVGIIGAVHFAAGMRNVLYADLDCDLLNKDHLVTGGGGELVGPVRFPSRSPGYGELTFDERLLGTPVKSFGP